MLSQPLIRNTTGSNRAPSMLAHHAGQTALISAMWRCLQLNVRNSAIGVVELLSRRCLHGSLYVLFCQLASLFVNLGAKFFSFVKCLVPNFTHQPVFLFCRRECRPNHSAHR